MGAIANPFVSRAELTAGFAARPSLLLNDFTAHTHTGNTSKTAVLTLSVPPLSIGDELEIITTWAGTGTAGAKLLNIEYGALALFSYSATNTLISVGNVVTRMVNLTAATQIGGVALSTGTGIGGSSAALPAGTVDSTVAQNLVFSVTLFSSADTMGTRLVGVKLIPWGSLT